MMSQAGPKILIVEDEFLIRLTLAEALADEVIAALEERGIIQRF